MKGKSRFFLVTSENPSYTRVEELVVQAGGGIKKAKGPHTALRRLQGGISVGLYTQSALICEIVAQDCHIYNIAI
jgi:hypothetical protein